MRLRIGIAGLCILVLCAETAGPYCLAALAVFPKATHVFVHQVSCGLVVGHVMQFPPVTCWQPTPDAWSQSRFAAGYPVLPSNIHWPYDTSGALMVMRMFPHQLLDHSD